jgi:hypothetical protein
MNVRGARTRAVEGMKQHKVLALFAITMITLSPSIYMNLAPNPNIASPPGSTVSATDPSYDAYTWLVFTQTISGTAYYFAECGIQLSIDNNTCSPWQVYYGGPGNDNGVSGTSFSAVMNASIAALASTNSDNVVVVEGEPYVVPDGTITLDKPMVLVLDSRVYPTAASYAYDAIFSVQASNVGIVLRNNFTLISNTIGIDVNPQGGATLLHFQFMSGGSGLFDGAAGATNDTAIMLNGVRDSISFSSITGLRTDGLVSRSLYMKAGTSHWISAIDVYGTVVGRTLSTTGQIYMTEMAKSTLHDIRFYGLDIQTGLHSANNAVAIFNNASYVSFYTVKVYDIDQGKTNQIAYKEGKGAYYTSVISGTPFYHNSPSCCILAHAGSFLEISNPGAGSILNPWSTCAGICTTYVGLGGTYAMPQGSGKTYIISGGTMTFTCTGGGTVSITVKAKGSPAHPGSGATLASGLTCSNLPLYSFPVGFSLTITNSAPFTSFAAYGEG